MEKIRLDIQKFATKSTTFSESNISIINNTSSLTINIYFSADNTMTYFTNEPLYCTCNGQTQSKTVSHPQGGSVSASFTFNNIAHNNDGSKSVSWSWNCNTGTSVLGNISDSGTRTLTKINRVTMESAPNFNDEENPTITFSNPTSQFDLRAKIEAGGNAQLIKRDLSKNATSCTFELTDEERNKLRNLIPNSNTLSVRFTICTMSGETELSFSYLDRTMTIVNGNPIFSNFEFDDVNSTTLALTGNSKKIIKGYSNVQTTISTSNKATSQKGATMNKYRFENGSNSLDINYSEDDEVSGTINNVTSGTNNVYAIDSRNNSTLVTKLATSVINYEPMTLNQSTASVERDENGVGSNCILKFNGTIWKGNFGAKNNSVINTIYKFKKTTETSWQVGTTSLVPTINDNGTYNFEAQIRSNNPDYTWDLNSSYNISIELFDRLSSVSADFVLPSAIPNVSLATEGVGIMCDYDENLGGLLQVGGQVIGNFNLDYSFEEQDTGIKWIDGKPIYKITINCGTFPNTTSNKQVPHNIPNIEKVVKIEGIAMNSAGNNSYTLPHPAFPGMLDNSSLLVRATNINIYIACTGNQSSLTAYVTLYYTKTTD